jgi:hypothetical protein
MEKIIEQLGNLHAIRFQLYEIDKLMFEKKPHGEELMTLFKIVDAILEVTKIDIGDLNAWEITKWLIMERQVFFEKE